MLRALGFSTIILGLASAAAAADATLKGSVYSLPPDFGLITDGSVEIRVFEPRVNGDGTLARDFSTVEGPLVNGSQIGPMSQSRNNGSFEVKVPVVRGGKRIVIVEFNRPGEFPTQRLNGIVVSDGETYNLDLTVPRGIPRASHFLNVSIPVHQCYMIQCRPIRRRCGRWH